MENNPFNSSYFDNYRIKTRSGRLQGDRRDMFTYWSRWLRRHLAPNSTVVEVGCGLGFFAGYLKNWAVYAGIDISEAAVAEAKLRHPDLSIETGDAYVLPWANQSAEALVIFDVVEHLPEPDRFFTEAARVLKPGGLLLITTPNIASFGNSVKDLESKTNKPAMYTDPTHCSLLDVQSWHKKLHASGFSIIRNQTDHLWDIPYSEKIPLFLQKVFLLPFNRITARFFGGYSWTKGENLILVARRKT